MLSSRLNSSGTLFKKEFQIIGAPEGKRKVLNGAISFIADKEVDLKIVLGGIEVIETMDFTPDLQLLIFKQDILPAKTLLLEFGTSLMTWQLPEQQRMLHLLYNYYSNSIAARESNPAEREVYNISNPKQDSKRQHFITIKGDVPRGGRSYNEKKSIKIMQGLFDEYSLVLSLYFNSLFVLKIKKSTILPFPLFYSPLYAHLSFCLSSSLLPPGYHSPSIDSLGAVQTKIYL